MARLLEHVEWVVMGPYDYISIPVHWCPVIVVFQSYSQPGTRITYEM